MKKKIGKTVALTSCSNTVYHVVYTFMSLNATTRRRWAGTEDGRYSVFEIRAAILNNTKSASVVNDIKKTDILIIDELSMFEQENECLSEVCAIKDVDKAFCGIQLVLRGDPFQFPPVPKAMYNDEGRYCFKCKFVKEVIPHTAVLNEDAR